MSNLTEIQSKVVAIIRAAGAVMLLVELKVAAGLRRKQDAGPNLWLTRQVVQQLDAKGVAELTTTDDGAEIVYLLDPATGTREADLAGAKVAENVEAVDDGEAIDGTFNVAAYRLEEMDERIAKVNARCEKLGLDARLERQELRRFAVIITFDSQGLITSQREVPADSLDYLPGMEEKRAMVEVRVFGRGLKLAGWRMLAAIEHLPAGNVLRVLDHGRELARAWRTVHCDCHHCNLPRSRKHTYLLENEDAEVIQVGRTCLKDFTGMDPAKVVWFTEALAGLQDDDAYGYGSRDNTIDTIDYLGWVVKSIEESGWLSRGAAYDGAYGTATADAAVTLRGMYLRPSPGTDHVTPPTDAQRAKAVEAVTWVREFIGGQDERSDYEHNLLMVIGLDRLEGKHYGIAASAIAAHARHLERELAKRRHAEANGRVANSVHLGEVGERLADLAATVVRMRDFQNDFGTTTLYALETTDGNALQWWSGGCWLSGHDRALDLGDEVVITGTVKAHKEYKGILETQLTRCTVRLASDPVPVAFKVRFQQADGKGRLTKSYKVLTGAKRFVQDHLGADITEMEVTDTTATAATGTVTLLAGTEGVTMSDILAAW